MLLLLTNMKRRADSTSKPSPLGNRPWKKFPTFLALDLHDPNKLNGDEGQLFRSLEATVFRYLKPVPLEAATDPVGLDESIGDFESFMESKQQNANKKVKIVGLGGSGKKTLPKEYFSGRRPLFERSSFLLGLRDASNRNALPGLQSWLLQDLSHVKDFKFDSVSEGMGIIRERLQSSTPGMFIVLDNIDHSNQVEAVLVEDVLRSGCLIIVTSREEGALEFLKAAPIYHIKQLRAKHAQYLFCKQAFQQFCPMCGFEKLVEKFCERCGGLPLFLKVMWAHLRISANNDRDHWEDKLKHRPHKEKQILWGVACFFLGEDKSLAIKMWDKCEGRGLHRLKNIENNCLVEFDDEYCFKMHDHLRDFGREIANKDSPCRLWNESQAANFREQHTNMSPWLRWFECPHTNISPWLMSMRNLTVLKLLCGDLQEWLLCDEQVHLRELRIVRTNLFMVSIPQNVCPCLEHLDLHCNIKLVEVKHLPQKLVKLNLNICTNLQELQGLKPLRQLRYLNISECSELSELPKLQHLTSLEGLYASDCTKLQHIHGLEHLSQRRDLNICRCSELSKLPKLLHLTSLETLDASACTNLQHTQGLKHLPRFRDLNISRCSEC